MRSYPQAAPLNQQIAAVVARLTEALLPPERVVNLRTAREWKHWINSLTIEALEDLTTAPMEVKRQLFKANVRLVEIETHAKCNRTCTFCPNSIVERRFNNTLTNAEMLQRLFQELGAIDYAGQIKVARYSEPLANAEYLCQQLAIARTLVPHAQLAIVTNTDYLTPALLDQLWSAGLDVVYMSIYLKAGEPWTLDNAHTHSERLARKLHTPIITRQETSSSLRCTYAYEGLMLHSACINFGVYGTDRGHSLKQYVDQDRSSPCREPFETFVIDYTGSVMPCCNLRSDLPQHQAFIVGELSLPGSNIFEIYAGQLAAWRRSLVEFGHKPSPCTTCNHRSVPQKLVPAITTHLQHQFDHIGYRVPTLGS